MNLAYESSHVSRAGAKFIHLEATITFISLKQHIKTFYQLQSFQENFANYVSSDVPCSYSVEFLC